MTLLPPIPCKRATRVPDFYGWVGVKVDKQWAWAWVKNLYDDLNEKTCLGFFVSGQFAQQHCITPDFEVEGDSRGYAAIESGDYSHALAIGIREKGYKGFRAVFIPFAKCSLPLNVKTYKKPSRSKQYPEESRVTMSFQRWWANIELHREKGLDWKQALLNEIDKILGMPDKERCNYVQSIPAPHSQESGYVRLGVRIDKTKADSMASLAKSLNMSRAKLLNLLLFSALQKAWNI